jgi:hypothetical protein
VCGNGVKEFGEECDDGNAPGVGCCTDVCTFAVEGTRCGDGCRLAVCAYPTSSSEPFCYDIAPPYTDCVPASSALGYVSGGGTLTTPDQSVTLTLPPGGPAGTYVIRGGLATSQFGVGTADTRIFVAEITPAGTFFASPGALLRLHWPDADDDGIVDGTTISEDTLALYKDGNQYTNPCRLLIPGPCTGGLCCDRTANEIVVWVSSLSEFVVVPGPELATTTTTSIPTVTTSPTPTTMSPTTTTIPTCTTVRCVLDDARDTAACAGHTLPSGVVAKLDRAISRIELAPSQTDKKAAKFYKIGKRLLAKAAKAAAKGARGKHPKLSADCAAALREAIAAAIDRVASSRSRPTAGTDWVASEANPACPRAGHSLPDGERVSERAHVTLHCTCDGQQRHASRCAFDMDESGLTGTYPPQRRRIGGLRGMVGGSFARLFCFSTMEPDRTTESADRPATARARACSGGASLRSS